ncbi:c-type cytochrome [Brachymonas sp. M4Q-1]|uniref:c-type cytochrome n=1 Tax=Brachymonas sp. M4Q-1 TaxID=3416906 RepID=UPI003CED784F
MKPLTSIAASLISATTLLAASAAMAAGAPDLAKGKASFVTCAACHGANGNSAIAANPSLAQQHPEYLVKQLKEFKAGVRKNAIMNGMAAPLSEQDMRNIAYWVTTQKMMPGSATNKDTIALGEKIWRGGIANRGVPACAACHSPNGAGIPIRFPRLAGQHAAYVEQQLKDFRDGVRTNDKVMPEVVNGMNDAQIKAVADFVQGLH